MTVKISTSIAAQNFIKFTSQRDRMFDFKKEFKQLYAPKQTPQILTVPPANFVCVRSESLFNMKLNFIRALATTKTDKQR